jgi:hypothetical protein
MDKISNAQIAEVLTDAASTLRDQQAYIQELEVKIASGEKRDRAEKIASEMHRKGIELDVSVEQLADRLEKTASEKLSTIEQAVDLVGPDMGSKIGSVSNHERGTTSDSNDLERFILGDAG